jgi:hypothetical protein
MKSSEAVSQLHRPASQPLLLSSAHTRLCRSRGSCCVPVVGRCSQSVSQSCRRVGRSTASLVDWLSESVSALIVVRVASSVAWCDAMRRDALRRDEVRMSERAPVGDRLIGY